MQGIMRKQIVASLFVLTMLFLGACGNKKQESGTNLSTENQGILYNISDEMSVEEKYALIANECIGFIQIKINPAFELYIAAEDGIGYIVLEARPINEDAKKLLKKLTVSNTSLWDALFSICSTAEKQGYLTSNSNMRIEYYGQMEGHDPMEVISDALKAYQDENKITFGYDTVCNALETPDNEKDILDENGNLEREEEMYDVVERDDNGNVIKTVYRNIEDNCVETRTYDSNGTLLSFIFEDINHGQTHEEYYETGLVVKKVTIYSGGIETRTYDNNGNMTSEIHDDKESGSYSEGYWTYYANGDKASYRIKLTDGYYTQGYYKEEQYYQGGAISMSHEVSQYGDNKFFYDANGNPTQYEGKNSNGERVETVYNSDGSYVSRIHESGGKVRIENWGADGSLTVTY